MVAELAVVAATPTDGDVQFGAFYEAHVEPARRLAWRLLGGGDAAAEDVVQNAFVKAFRSLPRFRGEAQMRTWLYRIVVNESHNHRRWKRVRKGVRSFFSVEPPDPRTPAPGDPGLQGRITRAMDGLSRTQREVIVLIYLEGMTVREAAELLERAEGTIKTHLHRALKTLRSDLADLMEESRA